LKTGVHVIVLTMAGGRNVHASRIVMDAGQKRFPRSQGEREPNYDTKHSQRGTDPEGRSEFEPEREETRKPKATSHNRRRLQNSTRASVSGGWNHVKGEWIHSDGYKYVKGQVVRTGAQTHKRPPKPPSKSLLNSVKIEPSPTPAPDSAAAKAAEIERNKRPRPAPQTGSNL